MIGKDELGICRYLAAGVRYLFTTRSLEKGKMAGKGGTEQVGIGWVEVCIRITIAT